MKLEERVTKIEEAVLIMKDLLVSRDERLEDYFNGLHESRDNFNFKINALVDAQIKLIDAQAKNEAEIGDLKEASRLQLNRIEKLENKIGIVNENTDHRRSGFRWKPSCRQAYCRRPRYNGYR